MNRKLYLLGSVLVITVLSFQNCGKSNITNNSNQDEFSSKTTRHTEQSSDLKEIGKEMVSGAVVPVSHEAANAMASQVPQRRTVGSVTNRTSNVSRKKSAVTATNTSNMTKENVEYCDVAGKTINWGATQESDPCFVALSKVFPSGKMEAHKTFSVVSESPTWGGSVKILCSKNSQGKLEVDLYGVGQCHKGCEAEVTTGYYEVEGSKNQYFCDHQVPEGKSGDIVTGQYTGTKCHSVTGMGFELKDNPKLAQAQFKCGVDKYGKLRWLNINSGMKIAQSEETHPCEKDRGAAGCGCRGGSGTSYNWEKTETGKNSCSVNISGVVMYHGQNLTLNNTTAGRTGVLTLTCKAGKMGMDIDKSTCD